MKASDIPEAFRLQETLRHCDAFREALASEPLHVQAGNTTITVTADDPQRPLLDQALSDFTAYVSKSAEEKLAAFEIEPDLKPSEITGFPEDDLPPPVDPS